MAKKRTETVLDIPVEFGGVSIGDGVARLGVKIDRKALPLTEAERIFVGHRLSGRVTLGGNGDSSGQQKFVEDEHTVDGVFDVKRIGVSVKQITTGLAFNCEDIDVAEIAKLSKGSGRLVVDQVNALPEPEPKHKGPDSGEGDAGFDDDNED